KESRGGRGAEAHGAGPARGRADRRDRPRAVWRRAQQSAGCRDAAGRSADPVPRRRQGAGFRDTTGKPLREVPRDGENGRRFHRAAVSWVVTNMGEHGWVVLSLVNTINPSFRPLSFAIGNRTWR